METGSEESNEKLAGPARIDTLENNEERLLMWGIKPAPRVVFCWICEAPIDLSHWYHHEMSEPHMHLSRLHEGGPFPFQRTKNRIHVYRNVTPLKRNVNVSKERRRAVKKVQGTTARESQQFVRQPTRPRKLKPPPRRVISRVSHPPIRRSGIR